MTNADQINLESDFATLLQLSLLVYVKRQWGMRLKTTKMLLNHFWKKDKHRMTLEEEM